MKTKKIIAFMSAVAMIGTYSFTDFLPEYMGSPVSVVSAGTYENFEYSVNEEDEITITGSRLRCPAERRRTCSRCRYSVISGNLP